MIALCEEAQRWHTHPSFPLFCFFFFRLTLLLAPGGGFSRSGLFVSPFLGGFACLSGLVWLYDTRSVRDYSIHPSRFLGLRFALRAERSVPVTMFSLELSDRSCGPTRANARLLLSLAGSFCMSARLIQKVSFRARARCHVVAHKDQTAADHPISTRSCSASSAARPSQPTPRSPTPCRQRLAGREGRGVLRWLLCTSRPFPSAAVGGANIRQARGLTCSGICTRSPAFTAVCRPFSVRVAAPESSRYAPGSWYATTMDDPASSLYMGQPLQMSLWGA